MNQTKTLIINAISVNETAIDAWNRHLSQLSDSARATTAKSELLRLAKEYRICEQIQRHLKELNACYKELKGIETL